MRVIDVAHDIPKFDITAGAYVLYSIHRYAPRGAIFLVVVDPGVGGPREPIAVETRNYYLVGPNNGILWPVIEEDGFVKAVRLDNDAFWVKPVSYTFHGRDIFAPAATMLALGVDIESLGSNLPPEKLIKLHLRSVDRVNRSVCMRVVYIDEFGNVSLSATQYDKVLETVCGSGKVKVYTGDSERVARCARTFSEVGRGELALYYNSFGFVELAVYMGSAARQLGLNRGDKVCLEPLDER